MLNHSVTAKMSSNDATANFILQEDDIDNVISDLIAAAPKEEIKGILRIYEFVKSTRVLKKDFNRRSIGEMQRTSVYLNCCDNTEYLKHELINNIICRIQNLFPDKYHLCKEVYSVNNDDKSFLPCIECLKKAWSF